MSTPLVGASAPEAPCFMEAPSLSAGRKRSSTHLTCKQASRTPHLHCPNPACMGKHIYRRRCECGKACVWRCPQCEAVVSASNAARHKCRPSMAAVPQAPPVAMRRRLLWVMRGLEHHNRVALPSDFLVPPLLRDQFIREQDNIKKLTSDQHPSAFVTVRRAAQSALGGTPQEGGTDFCGHRAN